MIRKTMRCPIDDASDWHDLTGYHSYSLIHICKKCGFLCHDIDVAGEEKIKEFYRNNYKPVLNVAAIITAGNKLQYITQFLQEHLEGKTGLVCADIGAATGYVLNWLRQKGHKVTGCEWTLTNRRLCEHFYGIPLTEELNDKHKYDLMSMYHVLEHLIDPDKKLEKYRAMLTETGRLMIATPIWLRLLQEDSGQPLVAQAPRDTAQGVFNELFHKNHINIFTIRSIKNLFNRAGFMIAKENFESYGQTYLLKAGEKKPIEPEDWQIVSDTVTIQRKALDLYIQRKYQDAVKIYPLFPESWLGLIFGVYGKDPERQADMLQEVPPLVRECWRFMSAEARWLSQLEKLDEALELLKKAMSARFQVEMLFLAGEILTRQGKLKEAMGAFARCAELHPHRWMECYSWIINNATKMQTWDERAKEEISRLIVDKAFKEGAVKISDPDPVGLSA